MLCRKIFWSILTFNLCNFVPYAEAAEALEKQLYTDLFVNYSTSLRPISSSGTFTQKITVTAQFGIGQIENLNEKEQQLTTHGFITLMWKDELLTWDPAAYQGAQFIIVQANEVWLPEITPVNSVLGATELASLKDDNRVRIYADGTMLWIPSLTMKTSCSIDVSNFPYDSQTCLISYANWMYTNDLLNFTAIPEVDSVDIDSNQPWSLTSASATAYVMTDGSGDSGGFPTVEMTVKLKRNPKFFELNVVLPALLLGFLLMPMFMLPVESGEKVSLGVTLMLAYTIFLLMMTDVTPTSGTTPKLTIAILICTIVNGIAVLTNVLIINIHHHNPTKPVPKWLKTLVLGKLAKLLCGMKYVDENEVQPFTPPPTTEKESSDNEKQFIKIGKEFTDRFNHSDMAAILKILEDFQSRKIESDVIEGNKENWNNLARVIDRLFLVLFSLFFVGYICGILGLKFTYQ